MAAGHGDGYMSSSVLCCVDTLCAMLLVLIVAESSKIKIVFTLLFFYFILCVGPILFSSDCFGNGATNHNIRVLTIV